jgi:glutathione S-transferase
LAPQLVLQDVQQKLDVEFELVLVDRKSDAQKSADYLALNPAGRIPTLVDGDLVVFESAAICMHLCEQNPQANLISEIGHPDRPLFHQWFNSMQCRRFAKKKIFVLRNIVNLNPSANVYTVG